MRSVQKGNWWLAIFCAASVWNSPDDVMSRVPCRDACARWRICRARASTRAAASSGERTALTNLLREQLQLTGGLGQGVEPSLQALRMARVLDVMSRCIKIIEKPIAVFFSRSA